MIRQQLYDKSPIYKFLGDNGFNHADIRVYLDIFKYDQSFASSVAMRTGIDRTTVYSVIKRLLKKGVIAQTKIKNTRAYFALSPKVFSDRFDNDIEMLGAQKKIANVFEIEMQKIRRRSFVKPRTKIFEGTDSIINLYKQTLETGGEHKSFLTIKRIPLSLRHFLRNEYMSLKVKNGVFSKVLLAQSEKALRYQSLDKLSNRQTKIIQKHPFDLHAEIVMFNKNEIAIIDFGEHPYGIIIDSSTLYATLEALFDYIWINE